MRQNSGKIKNKGYEFTMKGRYFLSLSVMALMAVALPIIGGEDECEKTLSQLKALATRHADNPRHINNYANALEQCGRIDEAITLYQRAATLSPESPIPLLGLGDAYWSQDEWERAQYAYEQAVQKGSSDQLASQRLSWLLGRTDKKTVINADKLVAFFRRTRSGSGKQSSISFSERAIPFEFNQYQLKVEAKAQLDELAQAIKQLSGEGHRAIGVVSSERSEIRFRVVGHGDERGSDQTNMDLSLKRAQAVIDYLVMSHGCLRQAFIAQGQGKRYLLKSGCQDENCHAFNRRVEFAVDR